MPSIPTLPTDHFPRIVTLAGGALARVTRCDATDIAFDRVEAFGTTPEAYAVTAPAQAVPPIVGFDPATAETWPTDETLAAAIVAALNAPAPRIAAFVAAATAAVQAMLDARARQSGYEGIVSACSYAAAPGSALDNAFAAEGTAFLLWRSAVWAACYTALGAHNPADPLPEMNTFLASLPVYVPPA